ncbi:hypothetical protein OF83DRAFT_1140038 [Amylostereum chailletii]|nr:hypothetical protein OF83DRAFT_1140038 [Amylostereum chailletii]
MVCPLTALPNDLHILLFLLVSLRDVLALKQTCRVLHACGSSDYLWHQIARKVSLPLRIPPDISPTTLSGQELQRLIIHALNLESNWKATSPRITKCTPVVYRTDSAAIDEMQLLAGATVLVTAQRVRRMGSPLSVINIWSIANTRDVYRAASLEVPGQFRRFVAAFDGDRDTVTLAITTYAGEQVDKGILQIYDIPLIKRSEYEYAFHVAQLKKGYRRPANASGIIHELAIQGDLVAAMFIDFDADFPGHSYQLSLINTKTWVEKLLHPKFNEPLNRLSVKLTSDRVILVGATTDTIVVRVLNLPHGLATSADDRSFKYRPSLDNEDDRFEDYGHLAELSISSCPNPIDSDTFIYHSITMPDTVSLLFFDLQDALPGHGHLVRLFFGGEDAQNEAMRQDQPFPFPAESSVKLVRIGITGRRAVWVEQNWETDDFRIMRSHFPLEDPASSAVSVLLPPNPALPFTPRSCQSLAFDETTGRLCCGLFNGDLWILDFD